MTAPRRVLVPLTIFVGAGIVALAARRDLQPVAASGLDAGDGVTRTELAPPAPPVPGGSVYNLRVATDASPDVTDLDALIHTTTSQWSTAREKVLSLFYATHRLRRQTSPMVLHGHEVTDPIRNFQDYGFTMCSTVTGINQTLHEQLGLRHQYWDICGHTVANVEYDGRFHLIDNSFSNLVLTDDGVTLASVQEAAAGSARLVKERSLQSSSPFGFLTGSDTMRPLVDTTGPNGKSVKGYASSFCETGLNFRDYFYNWDAGHRYVLNLREHESYTRYYRPLQETPGAEDPPEYWVASEKIDSPDPAATFQIDKDNRFGNRGNGRWTFSPSLAAGEWDRAVHEAANVTRGAIGLQPASAAAPGDVIYKVQGANAIASQVIAAQFMSGSAEATATVALSLNHGSTWSDVGLLSLQTGSIPLVVHLRNEVNGAYETLVRIRMSAGAGSPADAIALTGLTLTTITTLNVHALPGLYVGRNEVFVGLGDQSDTMVLWPDLRGDRWRHDAFDSGNIGSQPVNVPREYTGVVYPAVLTQDAHLTYRMTVARDLTRVVYGGRLYNRQAGGYIDFLHSFDEGATWTRSYRLSTTTKPYDVIHYETVTDIPPGVRSVRFKFLMHNASTTVLGATGLYSVRMEVNHRPQTVQTAPVEVTLRWAEVQPNRGTIERSHTQVVAAFPARYTVNVGGSDHPVMRSMTLNVAGAGDGSPLGYSDGIDPGGTRFVPTVRTDGVNLARNQPYTLSRPPSGFQGSAPATNTTLLTDGVIGSPVTGDVSYWWGQCWTSGTDVDLQVTLGTSSPIGAFRAHVFGYPGWDALKGQIQDRVEVLTSADGVSFTSRGLLKTSVWKKDIPINYMLQDDGRATGWNVELMLPDAVTARHVKFRLTPRRDTCVSELQILDRVTDQPFEAVTAPPWMNRRPSVALTSPAGGADYAAPAVFTLAAIASDADGAVARVEFLANGNVIGEDTSAPYTFLWQAVPPGAYSLTARAIDNAGGSTVSAAVPVTVRSTTGDPGEIVLHAAIGPSIIGGWTVVNDASAASGARLQNPNAGAAKLVTPLAAPTLAFELSFHAEANRPYRLWLRGKAVSNSYNNDSVFVQFDRSVTATGVPMWRINTADAAAVILEECNGCGVAEWGWADTGYGTGVLGPLVYFEATGPQRLRVQAREDGLGIDQIVLSAQDHMSAPPGAARNDATILPPTPAPPPSGPIDEIVLYAAADAQITGAWAITPDASAASGARLQNPNAGAAKLTAALADPANAFDLAFHADAARPYRVWIRGRALGDNYNNDSVFVQFDHSVDQAGAPVWRLGTTSASSIILEACSGCGVQGWGWADNGYGVLGPLVYFGTPGPQRLRIQVREDGLAIDQVVLSAVRYITTPPGAARNDVVIVPR